MVLATGFAMAQKTTYVTQGGIGNTATVTQDASISGDATKIYATQYGSYNKLTTDQLGNDNYVELLQGDNNNSAVMTQTTTLLSGSSGKNSSLVNQGGTSNKAELTQKEATIPGLTADLSNNRSEAYQTGNYGSFKLTQGPNSAYKPINDSYLTQSGIGNTGDLNQFGKTNYSEINQKGGSYNTADLDQTNPVTGGSDKSYSWQLGNNNKVDVLQTITIGVPLGSTDQYAYSKQDGTSNNTTIEQISRDVQKVDAIEQGNYDILTVTQHY